MIERLDSPDSVPAFHGTGKVTRKDYDDVLEQAVTAMAEERGEVRFVYLLAREHWGRGLATEAAGAIAARCFETLDVDRLIALIDEENGASLRVAEKLGMAVDGDVEEGGEVFPAYSVTRAVVRRPHGRQIATPRRPTVSFEP